MTASEIAFIDPGVAEIGDLLCGLRHEVQAIVLDPARGAIRQIADALAGHRGLRAVHIIAHGAAGEVGFSSGALSLVTIADHAKDLARIGEALDSEGELLLWSCATGNGPRGERFVDALCRATGADVAAANGLVGAAALGGRWELDARLGATAGRAPLTAAGVASYAGVMPTNNFTGGAATYTSCCFRTHWSSRRFIPKSRSGPRSSVRSASTARRRS